MHPEVSEKNTLKIERIDSEVIVILCRVSAYRCLKSINKSSLRPVRSEATKPPLWGGLEGVERENAQHFHPSASALKKPAAVAAGFFSAEAEGFEPPERCRSTVFKTAAIDHSATPPCPFISESGGKDRNYFQTSKIICRQGKMVIRKIPLKQFTSGRHYHFTF